MAKKSKSEFATGYNHFINHGIMTPENSKEFLTQMKQASGLPSSQIFRHVKHRKVDVEQAQIEAMMGKLGT